jgi:phosphatidylinositol glycan class W
MANSTASYKQLKEDFVSNLSGGSVSEIAQVCAVAPVCDITERLVLAHC